MRYGKLMVMALSLMAAPAMAADQGPSYDKGPVWDFGQIKTVDGHFDDYMSWLAGPWKEQQEALKKEGYILDYKVLLVADPRKGEPDIILATKYANMAAFDHSTAEEYAVGQKIWGSMSTANKEQAARSSIRTVLGDMVLREAVLK
ncbi:hypothetical protein [Novosphingobium mangrovi (ex Huang et al. 2023)]|uniref:DUF4136 domain-containing protein n=1 Tax=Novosphingobium mangrovi (ex Huang et al. 2023) TaxID=2976432 RepID=A0ABT2I805_9SPHN|nr:hypothetical protein [Novosphingobium mangrovi (ex Huang et al. 2023)]MCT2400949.1 hypothetical protein [Novosphingobium mangrovi (ex Huang et al. 2023)]